MKNQALTFFIVMKVTSAWLRHLRALCICETVRSSYNLQRIVNGMCTVE